MDFSANTVLVVGDVMLDRFVEGEIERISPEAPVPVLRLARTREMPGGAGNVASNIASLGGRAVLVGLAGLDEAAGSLGRLVTASGRVEVALVRTGARPTICKTRFIAGRQQVVRTDEESLDAITADEERELLDAIEARIGTVDAVILSDYGKGALSSAVIASSISRARARGIPVFVDPKFDDFARYRGATCITPNQAELGRAARRTLTDAAGVVAAAMVVMDEAEADAILATRSEKGMVLIERGHAPVAVASRAREVFDVSGAGDTVIATLALAHAAGRTLAQSMRIANAAAGVVVSKLGTATATIAEVLHELGEGHDDAPRAPSRLQTAERAVALVAAWREQGLLVGFTNGCFDILHAGHVALLAQARAACDRLVVGVNTDAGVARLKGAGRPVNELAGRAAVLAALRDVDCVVAFDDPTPLALIETLAPDVLVKGADYTRETVVGAAFVEARGGRVVLAELVAGVSTTAIIARAKK